jgi:hypothetical protein
METITQFGKFLKENYDKVIEVQKHWFTFKMDLHSCQGGLVKEFILVRAYLGSIAGAEPEYLEDMEKINLGLPENSLCQMSEIDDYAIIESRIEQSEYSDAMIKKILDDMLAKCKLPEVREFMGNYKEW